VTGSSGHQVSYLARLADRAAPRPLRRGQARPAEPLLPPRPLFRAAPYRLDRVPDSGFGPPAADSGADAAAAVPAAAVPGAAVPGGGEATASETGGFPLAAIGRPGFAPLPATLPAPAQAASPGTGVPAGGAVRPGKPASAGHAGVLRPGPAAAGTSPAASSPAGTSPAGSGEPVAGRATAASASTGTAESGHGLMAQPAPGWLWGTPVELPGRAPVTATQTKAGQLPSAQGTGSLPSGDSQEQMPTAGREPGPARGAADHGNDRGNDRSHDRASDPGTRSASVPDLLPPAPGAEHPGPTGPARGSAGPARVTIGTIEVTVVPPARPPHPAEPARVPPRPPVMRPAASSLAETGSARLRGGLRRWYGIAQG
jgi:hypothetical protein